MPIETNISTINSLDPSSPNNADPVQQGSAHLRNIKASLKATFPNVSGPITFTQAQANRLPDMIPAHDSLVATAVRSTSVNAFIQGPLTLGSFINATKVKESGADLIPRGVITMWFGTTGNIPPGWALCDGLNGTPDLRDRFVIGAGGSLPPWSYVGTNTQSVNSTQNGAATVGARTSGYGGATISGTTSANGAYGGLTSQIFLTQAHLPRLRLLPANNLNVQTNATGTGRGIGGGNNFDFTSEPAELFLEGGGQPFHLTFNTPDHAHTVTLGVPDHDHAVTVNIAAHAHNVTFDNRPLSTALYYIMKL